MNEHEDRIEKMRQSLTERYFDKSEVVGRKMSQHELESKLGMRIGKARNKLCPCGSGKKVKRCCGA